MNNLEKSQHKSHGTIGSYISGFILSLIFTAIPYYLVTEKILTGNTLLGIILGIAVLQMAIQVFFFLHLGRGPKPMYNVVFFAGTIGLILVVVGGSIFIMNNLQYNMAPAEVTKKLAQDESIYQVNGALTGACEKLGANHKVIIKENRVIPAHTDARYCDTLSFINEDSTPREIAFGPHPNHDTYAGQSDQIVRKNYAKIITLNQTGTIKFHDHENPLVAGDFTVTK